MQFRGWHNTLYVCNKNLDFVLELLKQQSSIALKWFEDNYIKMNPGKCDVDGRCVSGNKYDNIGLK